MSGLACALVLAGAAGVYLGAPQRLWWRARSPRLPRWGGALAIVVGTLLWMQAIQPLAGLFAAVTSLMLMWVLLPYLAAWQSARLRQGGRHGQPR